jgi:hypothetical protein
MADGTGRWTAARRRFLQITHVKTTISRCPRAGRWQPTMPIHYTSSDRTAGEHTLWLLQVDVYTGLWEDNRIMVIVPGLCGPLQASILLGQRTESATAIL